MEITCTRCHRTVEADTCYCSTCGLPQLQYTTDGAFAPSLPERGGNPVRDAASVEWKTALRWALLLAIPAGILSSGISPLGSLGLMWMTTAACWAVMFYIRGQKPLWITLGAGARIGLVTGLLAGWLAFGISSGGLLVERFVLHHSSQIDAEWSDRVAASQQLAQRWTSGMEPGDAGQAMAAQAQIKAMMLSPAGHAGIEVFGFATNSCFLLLFGALGGALGARLLAHKRRTEV